MHIGKMQPASPVIRPWFLLLLLFVSARTYTQDTLSCLPEGIFFETQAQIDSFTQEFPGCKHILGGVFIQGADINNLGGLHQIESVGTELQITQCPLLTGLQGLNNLAHIGQSDAPLYGLYISDNQSLINLDGLQRLAKVDGVVSIAGNPELSELTGLNSLDSIGDFLIIFNNQKLSNLNALSALKTIGGFLIIDNNQAITTLTGLDQLDGRSILQLKLKSNILLTHCAINSICTFLEGGGLSEIAGNASGCNSRSEIETECLSNIAGQGENELKPIFYLDDNKQIQPEASIPPGAAVILTSTYGRVIHQWISAAQPIVLADDLPAGVYVLIVATDKRIYKQLMLIGRP
ncbi:MAG: hypothetical protein KKD74_11110 [Bacteroidetes bacterium]|nr:hypothetical protein [Bacteroidota bacterium]